MDAERESMWSRWSSLPNRQRSWGDVWTAVAIALGYTLLLALTDGMGFAGRELLLQGRGGLRGLVLGAVAERGGRGLVAELFAGLDR